MTTIEAKGGGHTVKGHSGKGGQTGSLLDAAIRKGSKDAAAFKDYLSNHPDMRLKRMDRGYRSGFTCAEPNAVAKLLNMGVHLDDISFPGAAKSEHGLLSECVFCMNWVDGPSVDTHLILNWRKPTAGDSQKDARFGAISSGPRETASLAEFIVIKPARSKKGRRKRG